MIINITRNKETRIKGVRVDPTNHTVKKGYIPRPDKHVITRRSYRAYIEYIMPRNMFSKKQKS
jgi:hypothetical protein